MPTLQVTVDNHIHLDGAPPRFLQRCKQELTFDNPAYQEAIKRGRRTHGIPRKIRPYTELNNRISLPRGYWSRFCDLAAEHGHGTETVDNSVQFDPTYPPNKVAPRDYQEPWVEGLLSTNQGVGVAPPGCHPAGTGVLMADGTIKLVENVRVGDRLMGQHGARAVLQLRRGRDAIYKVHPHKGTPFFVNAAHKLTLVWSGAGKDGELVDPTIKEYLKLSPWAKSRLKLLRCPVEKFDGDKASLSLDPYFLGLLLGNGSLKYQIGLSTTDSEISSEARKQAEVHGVRLREERTPGKCPTYFFAGKDYHNSWSGCTSTNPILATLQELGLHGCGADSKFIPHTYKTGSKRDRLELLAGLLDAGGHLNNNTYDFILKSKVLADDLIFVCRSLGLAAYSTARVINNGLYWRVCVSGNTHEIPCRLSRKKATPRSQVKNVCRSGFWIEKVDDNQPYYGFTVDGDHRYLLADFTLTRNSGKTIMGLMAYARLGQPCLWLTHTGRLVRQARVRARDFLGIDAGIIGKGKEELAHFTVGSIQTLMRRDLEKYRKLFGMVILDECHHAPAKTFLEVLSAFDAHYRYGLTATPYREDGLGELMFQAIGPALCYLDKGELRQRGQLMTPFVRRRPTNFYFPYNPTGGKKFNYKALCDALADDNERNNQIATDVIVESSLEDNNICIVLVGRIPHGEELYNKLSQVLPDVGFVHSRMSSKKSDEILDAFENGKLRILVATYRMLAEGFDYQPTNRLFLTAPYKGRSLIEQACGRIERTFPGKTNAVVFDYVDTRIGVLNRQAEVRLDVYEANAMPVATIM